jgi:ATPase subunit of ABC transporter with duplicated ATPase domains
VHGGTIVAQGTAATLEKRADSVTGRFLKVAIPHPLRGSRRPVAGKGAPAAWVSLKDASLRNLKGFDVRFPVGRLTVVCGVSGAGKSTMFKLITGQEKPDGGTIKVGETVKLAYVDQSRDDLKPEDTIWQAISGGTDIMMVGKREINSRAYVGSFNFKGGDQQKKVGQLSGGERNRVHLAKTLASGGNLILLDEPTNDLDIETLQNLEEALEEFAGCAVVISHDRWFLDRLATHILAFEGDGHVEWFEGNFEAYEQDKMRRLGADSIIPKRLQHQKFGR